MYTGTYFHNSKPPESKLTFLITCLYITMNSWNTAKVGIKHQSINQSFIRMDISLLYLHVHNCYYEVNMTYILYIWPIFMTYLKTLWNFLLRGVYFSTCRHHTTVCLWPIIEERIKKRCRSYSLMTFDIIS
jgi:hypothetical protein